MEKIIAIVAVGGLLLFFLWVAYWYAFGGGALLRKADAMQDEQRGRRAQAKGWEYAFYEPGERDAPGSNLNVAYRLRARAGAASWEIHYDIDRYEPNHDYDTSRKYRQRTPRARLEFAAHQPSAGQHAWQVTDKNKYAFLRKLGGNGLTGTLAKAAAFFSENMRAERQFHQHAQKLNVGSAQWQQRFALVAASDKYARLIDPEIEALFLSWPSYRSSLPNNSEIVFVTSHHFYATNNSLLRGEGADNCLFACLENDVLRIQLFCNSPSFDVIKHMAKLGECLLQKHRAI